MTPKEHVLKAILPVLPRDATGKGPCLASACIAWAAIVASPDPIACGQLILDAGGSLRDCVPGSVAAFMSVPRPALPDWVKTGENRDL